jgi:DNA-binding response OmpR family regulator
VPRIVIAVDDAESRALVRGALSEEGHDMVVVDDGAAAIRAVDDADLLLLDVRLPVVDGWGVLEHVKRRRPALPVVMVTEASRADDEVRSLQAGADDFVATPFDLKVLRARVAHQLDVHGRRVRRFPGLTVDPVERRVVLGGREIPLTPTEFDLLATLTADPGRAFSRADLLAAIWGREFDDTLRTVDVMIASLRRKLVDHPQRPRFVGTIRGHGYAFVGHRTSDQD